MKKVDPAGGNGPDRIAVVRLGVGQERLFPFPAAFLLPVLEGHLDGDLHGCGAVVRVEDAAESLRRDGQEPLRQLDGGTVGKAQEGRVAKAVQLGADGFVDLCPAMAEQVDPQGGDAVEVPAAFRVDQVVPLAPFDDEGCILFPLRHLGEGVPYVFPVFPA